MCRNCNPFHLFSLVFIFVALFSCKPDTDHQVDVENPSVSSPNDVNQVNFNLTESGNLSFHVLHNGKEVVKPSQLAAFDFQDQPSFGTNLNITNATVAAVEDDWVMPWGEQRNVENRYNELTIHLEESEEPARKLLVKVRAFDDGIGFRYEFPAWNDVDSLIFMDEHTNFQITGDHTAWWIPGDWDIYEHLYNETLVSGIDAISKRDHPNLAQTYIPENAVNTPVTMRSDDGLHLSFHEADLTNFPGMTLKVDNQSLNLQSELVGSDKLGYKAKVALPFQTPWRTIQIADEAAELIESNMIVNLNDENKLGDVSWFSPMKYVGIWWEMHLGVSTWDMEATQDMNTFETLGKEQQSSKHGATTENTKRYIDFAAENGIGGVLVEGWNTGWDHWIGFEDREGVFDFVTPYDDYDIDEVTAYAEEKGVEIIMHHETSAAPRTYDQQKEEAYQLMQKHGMHSVKTGYVGKIIPKGEYHHGQWMVNHYHGVLEKAAEYKVAINAHEPIKATGKRRTYPNAISREGLRGQEFNAWATDGGNPPQHLPIVAFTRMLAGPIDFTPGAINIKLDPYKEDNQINTTLAQQLALYVVIYSPIQMACDLPENYTDQPAFQFIRDVGVDWEQSKVLEARVGDYVTIAREERDTGNWFVGGITDENARTASVDFSFLPEGEEFTAVLYQDADDAHWDDNPTAIEINEMAVTSETKVEIELAAGGGFAMSLLK
mgnify:CR=1 FL=1